MWPRNATRAGSASSEWPRTRGSVVPSASLRSSGFDLALIAFWELAAELLPLLRRHSPETTVVINSIDVHFLRNARRSFGRGAALGSSFGGEATKELNTYNAADAVIAVSDKEREFLADFLGESRVFTLPLAERIERSPYPLEQRRGMYFVGNFRHLPNQEAVEYLCAEVLPLLDRDLLERHPLTVLGNWLDQIDLHVDPAAPGVRLVGWVPSVQPYVERSRLAVVPLLHGAGVKQKVIQSLMAGTPVVTTPIGAEGLELAQGEHALIAADSADLAAGITRLLTEDDLWHRLAVAGALHVGKHHGVDLVERRFGEIIDAVMARRSRAAAVGSGRGEECSTEDAIRGRIQTIARPGDVILVATGADDDGIEVPSQVCWPFPQGRDGGVAGYDPADGAAAVHHLEAQRVRGRAVLRAPEAGVQLDLPVPGAPRSPRDRVPASAQGRAPRPLRPGRPRCARRPTGPDAGRVRVLVLGRYAAHRTGPPPDLRSAARLERAARRRAALAPGRQ